jgi:hypothetical protein
MANTLNSLVNGNKQQRSGNKILDGNVQVFA